MWKSQSKTMQKAIDDVAHELYAIGGPLNDDKLGYTVEQLKIFHRIAKILRPFESPRIEENFDAE